MSNMTVRELIERLISMPDDKVIIMLTIVNDQAHFNSIKEVEEGLHTIYLVS